MQPRPPPSPGTASLSRSLRKQRAKLGLDTVQSTPFSPLPSFLFEEEFNITSFSLPTASPTASPPLSAPSSPPRSPENNQHLPDLLLSSSNSSFQRTPENNQHLPDLLLSSSNSSFQRKPAFLTVPTINDKLGLNLLRLAEKKNNGHQTTTELDSDWSIHSCRSTTSEVEDRQPRDEERSLLFNTFTSSGGGARAPQRHRRPPRVQRPPPVVEPYFAKNGNVEHVRDTSRAILNNIRVGLETFNYKPNEYIDAPPPGQVTRICFDCTVHEFFCFVFVLCAQTHHCALTMLLLSVVGCGFGLWLISLIAGVSSLVQALLALIHTLTGPVQQLMLSSYNILVKNAFVDQQFINERLMPLGIFSDPTGTDTTTPAANDSARLATATSLLHTEAVVLLAQKNRHAMQLQQEWLGKQQASQQKLEQMQDKVDALLKKESMLKQQLTQLLRTEGSTATERTSLMKQEIKLKNDLKHAR